MGVLNTNAIVVTRVTLFTKNLTPTQRSKALSEELAGIGIKNTISNWIGNTGPRLDIYIMDPAVQSTIIDDDDKMSAARDIIDVVIGCSNLKDLQLTQESLILSVPELIKEAA